MSDPAFFSDSDIPKELQPWVATSEHDPAHLIEPSYIDFRAVADLAFYHPGFGSTMPQTFRHVAAKDDGKLCVVATSLSSSWHEKMAAVMLKVRLVPTKIDGVEVLVDENIGNLETPLMHGWKVKKWTVVNSRDSGLDRIRQDIIEWTGPGAASSIPVLSMFSWRPYPSLAEVKAAAAAAPVTLHEAVRGRRLFIL